MQSLPPITSFLSYYPHPAFILSAEPLKQALLGRKVEQVKETEEGIPLLDSTGTEETYEIAEHEEKETAPGDQETDGSVLDRIPELLSEFPTRDVSTGFNPHSTPPSRFDTLSPSALPLPPLISTNTVSTIPSHSSNGIALASKTLIDTSATRLSTNDSNTSTSSNTRNNRTTGTSASHSSSVASTSASEKILADAFNLESSAPAQFDPNGSGLLVGIGNAAMGGESNVGVGSVKYLDHETSISKSQHEGDESDRGSRFDQPSSHSSLLEGGNQANHDPSRTAEGAVTAMYEMRQKKADEKSSRVQQEKQNQMEGIVHRMELEKKAQAKSNGVTADVINLQDKEDTMEVEQERRRNNVIRPLAELLEPIWSNSKWKELIKLKQQEEDCQVGLLGLLGRTDAQKLLELLSTVLDSNSSKLLDPSITLTLNFPFQSIHHSSSLFKESASRLPRTFGGNSSSEGFSSRTPSSNIANGQTIRKTLELVATLYEGTNFLVITTVVSKVATLNLALPLLSRTTTEDSTMSNPSGTNGFSSPSSLPTRISSPVEPITSDPLVNRPDYLQHHSSINSTLSTSTAASDSTTTTLSPSSTPNSPGNMVIVDARQSYSLSHRNSLLASHSEARALDRTPNPAPQYSGAPGGTSSTSGNIAQFPDGFVLERKSRKTQKKREKHLNINSRKGKGRKTLSNIGEASVEGSDVNIGLTEAEDADEEILENGTDSEDSDPNFSISRLDPTQISPSPPLNQANLLTLAIPPAYPELSLFPPSTDPFLLNLVHTPMGRMIRAFPWETSPLGPILSWPPELKVMVTLCLATPFRNAIWYGPENVLIYNDEYAKIAGAKHPGILGKSGAIAWAEIWDTLGPLAARVMQGETVSYYDHHLPMNRNGFTEETYYIWSFVPFRGADGSVIGYDNPCFETTARVIAERRLSTIRDLVQVTSSARTVKEYCQKTLHSLASNPYDLVFCILYTVETVTPSTSKSMANAKDNSNLATYRLNLEGTIGVPPGHSSTPEEIFINVQDHSARESDASSDFSDTASGSTATNNTRSSKESWPFIEACASRKPVFISEDLENRTKGYERRGWMDPVKNALCIPIFYEDDVSSTPRAILVVGLNPRRPWNDIFATFFLLLSRSIASGMFSVFVAETDAQRANELAKLNRAKTNFFSNVSHELRTPLTLILGPLEDVLASKDTLSMIDRNRLVTVEKNAKRLLSMVNSLLDFSRLEGGKLQAQFRPTKLSTVTADLGSLFRSAIERGDIEYLVDCEPDPSDGPAVFLSIELWEKIIFNLVGNAFKYTMSGTITLQVRYTKREAIVKVIDTGCGIPENELSSVFERFHRVESTSRAREGTGIGLSLTLELVKILGGLLEVESELGRGSTFTVILPRGSAHLPTSHLILDAGGGDASLPLQTSHNLSLIDQAASWKVTSPGANARSMAEVPELTISSASSSDGSHATVDSETQEALDVTSALLNQNRPVILLIDDNEDLRAYISGILSKHFTVVQATDGQAALEYAFETPPDLVVTDVQMPKVDGRQFLEKFRSNPKTRLIAVIFLSADASPETRIDALNAGADDFLIKPFQSRELIARVRTHLTLGRMRIELEREVALRTEELVQSEMKFRGLADRYSVLSVLSPVGVFMSDINGNLSYANPRWYSISGHHADKPLDEWRDSVLPEDLPISEAVWSEAIQSSEGEKVHQKEFRYKAGNWVIFEIQPIFESGIKVGFVGAITDITRQKKLEALHIQIVDQRAADAEENRRQMELFIDMASHELRNPLSGVWQNAEVVGSSLERITEVFDEIRLEGTIPDTETLEDIRRELEENTEAVESIMLCASHQGRIADDILNVSKLNMGLLSVNPVPFDLVAKMTEVLKMFEVECQQKQISLTLSAGSSLMEHSAEHIIADPSRLAQILINFLTNSVKYTADAKRRSIVIRIDAFKDVPAQANSTRNIIRVAEPENLVLPSGKVWVVVGVQDSGKGLSSEELKKLFLRFSQANAKSDQYSGSGLGLYVSRALAELHEGFIEVESAPGEGSTFKFAIPAATVSSPTSATISGTTPSTRKRASNANDSSAVPSLLSSTMKQTAGIDSVNVTPRHVLVVEDNLINQKVMQRQLKIAKCIVTLAGNGAEALEAIQADHDSTNPSFDIVLMDIEMPIMNGLEAIRELRRREKSGVISRRYNVIAVTGNARQGQIDECLASGFDDVAIKPYKMTELLIQIHRLVDLNDLTPTG